MSKERVAIAKVSEQRLDEAVERVVGLLGGLDEIVPSGSRVLIKPNFVFTPTDRGITHPELLEAVVRMLKATSPNELVIAEGSADTYTTQSYRFQGAYRIASRYGATLVDLNREPGVRTPVPDGLGRDYVMLPRAVVDCDVFVSLPVFKLWGESPLSLCLKNLIGLYGGRYYGHNKDSDARDQELPGYGIPGEVGAELGAHKPTRAQSICALNSAVRTDLAIVDGLEGGDGQGNWIRLDTLVAGRNALATDTVAMAMAGFDVKEHDTFTLCAERGLGPASIEEIDVVGEPVERVAFKLERLCGNVLEMPLAFCLNLLSTGELRQIHRGLTLYELLPDGFPGHNEGDPCREPYSPEERSTLLDMLGEALSDGYLGRAMGQLNGHALALLETIIERGGTSGSMVDVQRTYAARGANWGTYYYPAERTLQRLGLAFAVDSDYRPYYLLPEGAASAFARVRRSQ